MQASDPSKKIILQTNLQGFFFEGLNALNKKSLCPVPESAIFYSSDVLDKFALSQDFFEVIEGKVRDKILGMKLLEASHLTREEQKRVYKDVADMALMVCGYFAESRHKKIVDAQYYAQIGKMAYTQLNSISPSFLDIPSFYHMFATCFESMTTLMSILASQSKAGNEANLIFNRVLNDELVTDREMLVSGIIPTPTRKVS